VAIRQMVDIHHLSERRACRLVGLSRDSYRHPPQMDAHTQHLSARIVDIAHARRRFGYRRIHDLIRPEFPGVNHKRVYRHYKDANLAVRRRKKAKRPSSERVPLQLAQTINEVWSMDFVSDSLASGRRIKCLTVADDFSRECLEIAVDYGISGEYVTRILDRVAVFRGYPLAVRTDNVLNARGFPTIGNSIARRSCRANRQMTKSDEQNRRRGSAAQGCLG
jgi:putative transposase